MPRQVKLYEQAFAKDTNMSGFLMSDNFFLKKITKRLNHNNLELEKKHLNTTIQGMNP